MKSQRTLHLQRETLLELTTEELHHVVGATHVTCVEPTHGNTSCDACPTVPINICVRDITTVIADTILCVQTG